MALSDEQIEALEALAKKHGALSYRNRADTQNPAFGFSVAGLASLLAEARRDALEEAAKVADAMAPEFGEKGWAAKERGDLTLSLGMLGVEFQLQECAAAIRALKAEPPPTA
jgi:hypothetical protein